MGCRSRMVYRCAIEVAYRYGRMYGCMAEMPLCIGESACTSGISQEGYPGVYQRCCVGQGEHMGHEFRMVPGNAREYTRCVIEGQGPSHQAKKIGWERVCGGMQERLHGLEKTCKQWHRSGSMCGVHKRSCTGYGRYTRDWCESGDARGT